MCKTIFLQKVKENTYEEKKDNFILDSLKGIERDLVFDYYWLGKTITEISLEKKISRSQVHKIIHEGLRKLKKCVFSIAA